MKPKMTQVVSIKTLTMTKRVAKALARHFEIRMNDLMLLKFEGWTYARDLSPSSAQFAVLCTVLGEEDRALWIVGSFWWLGKGRLADQRIIELAGHPQNGTTLNFIALT